MVLNGTTVRAVDHGASVQTTTPRSVRSTDAVMLRLIEEGTERSVTFAALVDTIGHSNDIVYVEFGYCAFGHLDGCLLPFVASSQGGRYLRVLVTPDKNRRTHDQLLALIGHELQHALEVIQHHDVVNVNTMDAMYRRIGTPLVGLKGYETSAARAAGDAVLNELSRTQFVQSE
jgi:hypothetical protein